MTSLSNAAVNKNSKVLAEHPAYIHQVSVELLGRRLAICSSDKTVKVYERRGGPKEGAAATSTAPQPLMPPSSSLLSVPQEWHLATTFEEHTAAVNAVAWSHPKLGVLLASCSADRTIRFYTEQNVESGPRWTSLTRMKVHDNRADAFYDLAFAPQTKAQPPKLAACNGDGTVRVYAFDETWVETCRMERYQ